MVRIQTIPDSAASDHRWWWTSEPEPEVARRLLALLILAPVALIVIAMRLGPGVSGDSAVYAYAAESFAETGRLYYFGGQPLTVFPPGLPIILGAFVWAGFDVGVAAIIINLVSVAFCVVLTYLLGLEVLRSRALSLLSAAVVGLSVATVAVFSMMWTEPPFSTLVLVVLLILTRASRVRRITGWQILAVGIAASVATTLRFIGVILIPLALLGIWIASRPRGRAIAARSSALAGLVASTGLVCVVTRNMSVGASPMGDRTPIGFGAFQILYQSVRTLGRYALPAPSNPLVLPMTDWVLPLTPLVLAVGAALSFLVLLATVDAALSRDPARTVTAAFVVLYWVTLLYSEFVTTIDPVDWRLTSPVFAPMVILLVYWVADFRRTMQRKVRNESRTLSGLRALDVAIATLVIATLAFSLAGSARIVERAASEGVGFNSLASINSPLSGALSVPAQGEAIAVNDFLLAYWNTGIRELTPIPRSDRWTPPVSTDAMVAQLSGMIKRGEVKELAFFDNASGATTLSPDELLARGVKIRFSGSFADGDLWVAAP